MLNKPQGDIMLIASYQFIQVFYTTAAKKITGVIFLKLATYIVTKA